MLTLAAVELADHRAGYAGAIAAVAGIVDAARQAVVRRGTPASSHVSKRAQATRAGR